MIKKFSSMSRILFGILVLLNASKILALPGDITYLDLPVRSATAITGSAFADKVSGFSLDDREKAIVAEILSGNVPSFSRKMRVVKINQTINDRPYELIYRTVCDYMAIGSDQDYLYIPMTPSTAQYLSDKLKCTLPTKKMVDMIYAAAGQKLRPQPIPPSPQMTTIPVFKQHTDSIRLQMTQMGFDRASDSIIGGTKKDIIISNKIYSPERSYERVVIYGWHRSVNDPIQPVYNGHIARYADYSHGIRLVNNMAILNGDSIQIATILKDKTLSVLLSDEGVINRPFYPASDILTSMAPVLNQHPIDFFLRQNYPNPFNPVTTIPYRLANYTNVDLSIFNLSGQRLLTLVRKKQSAGSYSIKWNAYRYASGIYIYRLRTGSFVQSRRMLLLQ